MSKSETTEFTDAELDKIFDTGSNGRLRSVGSKIPRRKRKDIGEVIAPYFMDENDPKFDTDKSDPRNSIKVLTSPERKRILPFVIKRKDGNMAQKSKNLLTLKQQISLACLVFLAGIGAASMLGLSWGGCIGGVAIAGMLGVFAFGE